MRQSTCDQTGCPNRHYAKGLCKRHYGFARKPDANPARRMTPEQWWWYSAQPVASGCWEWQGTRNTESYGRLQVNGRTKAAHRFGYEIVVGPIPPGLVIDHLCRNTSCVNPDHLEPVTNKVNILRGEGYAARSARKVSCPKGHAYDADNTWRDGRGFRYCRACRRSRAQRRASLLDAYARAQR